MNAVSSTACRSLLATPMVRNGHAAKPGWFTACRMSAPMARSFGLIGLVMLVAASAGCGQLTYRLTNPAPQTFMPNPLELPPAEDEFVWMQVVDVVDDYFRIAREQPMRNSDGLVLDGYLETVYRPGSSLFEPWRKDSTHGFQRLQSTLQSIRRRAIVTVRPDQAGYTIEVVVQKDLEDTDRSQYATESTAATRHDGTMLRHGNPHSNSPRTLGWIPLGRDTSLEQVILRDIFGRITEADRPKHSWLP